MEATIKKTWKPTVAGILEIIVGSGQLLGALGVLIAIAVIGFSRNALFLEDMWHMDGSGFGLLIFILAIVFLFVAAMGTVCLVGGIYALKRRIWGLALAGSIASLVSSTVLGILATIFVAMSKDEFVETRKVSS